jgi:Protein of unknown function (DUF3309)
LVPPPHATQLVIVWIFCSCEHSSSCVVAVRQMPSSDDPSALIENLMDTSYLERLAGRRIDRGSHFVSEDSAMLSTILIIILILILVGALPSWPYSAGWGYGPGGLVGTILIVVIILALLGRI